MKKAELTFETIVGIIIAVLILLALLFFALKSEGGPKSMIDSILGFMNTTSSAVIDNNI